MVCVYQISRLQNNIGQHGHCIAVLPDAKLCEVLSALQCRLKLVNRCRYMPKIGNILYDNGGKTVIYYHPNFELGNNFWNWVQITNVKSNRY